MKPRPFIAALAAAVSHAKTVVSHSQTASLRSVEAFSASTVTVDIEQGVIYGAAVMTVGPAKGYGWNLDQTSLEQLQALIAGQPNGVPVRFKHPKMPEAGESAPETLGSEVGYLRNVRIEGNVVRGDVYLADYAAVLPGQGNVREYLLRKAKSDPTGLGLSAVIGFDLEEGETGLVARIGAVVAVDFVGDPAANPNGLLSAKGGEQTNSGMPAGTRAAGSAGVPKSAPSAGGGTLHKTRLSAGSGVSIMTLKQWLINRGFINASASDADVQAAYDNLDEATKAQCDTDCAAAMAAVQTPPMGGAACANATAKMSAKVQDSGDNMIHLEGRRVAQLQQLGNTLGVESAVVQLAIASGDDAAKARTRYLEHLQAKAKPVEGLGGTASISVGGEKKVAALSAAMSDAVCIRGGLSKFHKTDGRGFVARDGNGNPMTATAHELADKYVGLSALDMYRQYLIQLGAPAEDVYNLSRVQLAELIGPRALMRRFPKVAQLAQSTSDFGSILVDAQNKSLRMGYVEAPRTWNLWAARGTAPDFKTINRVQLSEVPTLTQRAEGKGIDYVTLSDSKETYALAEYAQGVILTRRTLINDELSALTNIPKKQGQAAARLEDDVAYAILTANANLADGGALFNTTATTTTGGHANLVNTNAAITVASISAVEKLLMLQKGPKNAAILNIEPKILLVPIAIKTVAQQFVASNVDPSKSNATPNPYNGKLQVVPNARLDANSAAAWYLLADYRDGTIDTVEVSFLTDEPEPVLKQETDFDTDDQKFAIRHTVAAKALDFRGVAKS
jgi:hypothetical protein